MNKTLTFLLGIVSSIVATVILRFIDKNIAIVWYMILAILFFVILTLIYNLVYKRMIRINRLFKGINVYTWNLTQSSSENIDRKKFQTFLSPIIKGAQSKIICRLNTGCEFYRLFEHELKSIQKHKALSATFIFFTTDKDKYKIGEDGAYKKTIDNLKIALHCIKNKSFKTIKETSSLYTYIIIDDFCLFSFFGILLGIKLKKCNDPIKIFIEALNERILNDSENC